MRAFGRMAFLVYTFFLAEGFRHTRSAPRYALRLTVMGLLSTIPYCFTINKYFDFWTRVRSLNIYFTLACGVALMLLLRWRTPRLHGWRRLAGLAPLALILPVFLQFGVWELTQYIAVLLLAGGIGLLGGDRLPAWCRRLGDWAWKTAAFLILYQLLHEWTGIEVEYSYTALFSSLLWLCRNKRQSAAVLALAAVWMYPPVSTLETRRLAGPRAGAVYSGSGEKTTTGSSTGPIPPISPCCGPSRPGWGIHLIPLKGGRSFGGHLPLRRQPGGVPLLRV